MDALRQSLDRVSTGKKKAAKAEFEKPVEGGSEEARRALRRRRRLRTARGTARRSAPAPTGRWIPPASDPQLTGTVRSLDVDAPVTILRLWRNRDYRTSHTKLAQRAARDALDVVLVHTAPVTR